MFSMRVIQAGVIILHNQKMEDDKLYKIFFTHILMNRLVTCIYSMRKLNLPPLGRFLCHTPGF